MRPDGSPSSLREALAGGRRDLAASVAIGIAFIALGIAFPELLFSWIGAAAFWLGCVLLVPVLLRRLR